MTARKPLFLALSGGVGGARLALGLSRVLASDQLVVVANTGDDFEPFGLHVSPDLDTLTYTLAGLADEERGWGLAGETWHFMEALAALGGEIWFRLGDRDLALHVERTRRLAAGESLSSVTRAICAQLGVGHPIVPMSDQPVRTMVGTDRGVLAFQDWFVRLGCEPRVRNVRFSGAETAELQPEITRTFASSRLAGVIVCPSNPFISIDPILAVPGMRSALAACPAPVIAVSPIVAGKALKGPTATMMRDLGLAPSAVAVAEYYRGIVDGFVLDEQDTRAAGEVARLGIEPLVAQTVMGTLDDRVRLARTCVDFALRLAEQRAAMAR